MSKTLTFQIPDEIYKILEQQAEREGRTTESVTIEGSTASSRSRGLS